MLPIAGQTAGPNGWTFFVATHGCCKLKNRILKKIHGQRQALPLVVYMIIRKFKFWAEVRFLIAKISLALYSFARSRLFSYAF